MALTVPRSAIQHVGSRQVVYVRRPDDPSTLVEREVVVARTVGDLVEIVAGLREGEAVVSTGSFFVRAEAERLGLRSPSPRGAQAAPGHGH
jgi:multidrug efflux pump subunit AcrA (membrane-fusion protein)